MSETNKKIIDMILNNASANEISMATGLSNKQLFYRLNMLRTKGYNFSRKYYYDGEITYKLQKGFVEEKEISLITRPQDPEIQVVFISDLHLSNKKDRADLLNQAYEFCAKKGIHIIINGGDIIDGFLGNKKQKKFDDIEEQIDYALKVYPYDKNILNFTCLGNHEYDILEKTGQNFETILLAKRHDIIPLGYGIGKLNIKNDQIIVKHPKTPVSNIIDDSDKLKLIGHYHHSKTSIQRNVLSLFLPSLSNISNNNLMPGFITATFRFKNGFLFNVSLNHYTFFAKRIYKVNESFFELARKKDINNPKNKEIKYEEERTPYKEEKIKVLEKY